MGKLLELRLRKKPRSEWQQGAPGECIRNLLGE